MIIYIYGDKRFKKEVRTLLLNSGIDNDIEDVNSLELLTSNIKDYPDNIFLIEHTKIIDNKRLINKINFFKPKDAIDKSFLEQYGVGDICFNSMNGFVQYILSRLNNTTIKTEEGHSNSIENEENYEFNNSIDADDIIVSESIENRDPSNIISIDDIHDEEMVKVIDDFTLDKNINKD